MIYTLHWPEGVELLLHLEFICRFLLWVSFSLTNITLGNCYILKNWYYILYSWPKYISTGCQMGPQSDMSAMSSLPNLSEWSTINPPSFLPKTTPKWKRTAKELSNSSTTYTGKKQGFPNLRARTHKIYQNLPRACVSEKGSLRKSSTEALEDTIGSILSVQGSAKDLLTNVGERIWKDGKGWSERISPRCVFFCQSEKLNKLKVLGLRYMFHLDSVLVKRIWDWCGSPLWTLLGQG